MRTWTTCDIGTGSGDVITLFAFLTSKFIINKEQWCALSALRFQCCWVVFALRTVINVIWTKVANLCERVKEVPWWTLRTNELVSWRIACGTLGDSIWTGGADVVDEESVRVEIALSADCVVSAESTMRMKWRARLTLTESSETITRIAKCTNWSWWAIMTVGKEIITSYT